MLISTGEPLIAHTVTIVYVGCFLLAILCGFIRGYSKRLAKRQRDEERELLKWQRELEEHAEKIRAREKSLK